MKGPPKAISAGSRLPAGFWSRKSVKTTCHFIYRREAMPRALCFALLLLRMKSFSMMSKSDKGYYSNSTASDSRATKKI